MLSTKITGMSHLRVQLPKSRPLVMKTILRPGIQGIGEPKYIFGILLLAFQPCHWYRKKCNICMINIQGKLFVDDVPPIVNLRSAQREGD